MRALTVVLAATALASPGGSGTVAASGAVGALRIDRSTEAAVRRVAGRPAFARTARTDPSTPPYRALAYGCARSPGSGGRRDPLLIGPRGGPRSGVYCRTIYYVNSTTRKLAAFWTGSTAFRTAHGTRVGTTEAEAARRERRSPQPGCMLQILERTQTATLSIPLAGAKVASLELESTIDPVGLQFC